MKLTQKEIERLTIFNVAEVSRRRWRRGVKLNYVEVVAIISDELLERARDGKERIEEMISLGSMMITEEDVMEGVGALIPEISLEVMMPDGNKLISVKDPVRLEKRSEAVPFDSLVSMI